MKRSFYRLFVVFMIILPSTGLFAQQKYALVIGNSNYTGISKLANPSNDANDMAAALQSLGFTVDKVLDGDLERMETAVTNLKKKLGASRNSYGFFFYAGHGVQANGQNYLIPLPATNILNETHLRDRSVSLQFVLDSLSEAGNELNMIVLDACRDNPFGWSRSGSRGLSVVSYAPSGSIVMYAAASGQKADDGSGRNGLFTGHLLNNLKTTGLSVYEVFDKTMGDVKNVTGGRQDPELSLRFSGANSVYLGSRPTPNAQAQPALAPVQPVASQAQSAQTYKIGDLGPAGGIIFFDRGFTGDGWRYLEAAPAGSEFTAEWGAYGHNIAGTSTTVGSGKRNTEIIVGRLRQLGESGKAAQICVSLNFDGYKDWFLPSKDELDLMYKNLKQKGLGGFSNNWYWSSSQDGDATAVIISLSDGDWNARRKINSAYGTQSVTSVRAVRAF